VLAGMGRAIPDQDRVRLHPEIEQMRRDCRGAVPGPPGVAPPQTRMRGTRPRLKKEAAGPAIAPAATRLPKTKAKPAA